MDTKDKIALLLAKVEIYKLKADDYNWQVHTPGSVKKELEGCLAEIDNLLATPPKGKDRENDRG